MLSKSIILLAFMSAVYASTFRSWQKTLTWGPCQGDMNFTSDYPYQCATLNVPLDYTNPHGPARLNLALLKVNATKQPAMGSILFNPGGPGSPGTATVAEGAEQFQHLLDGNYDLIGFDPRGTGDTVPFTCSNFTQAQTASMGTTGSETVVNPLDDPTDVDFQDLIEALQTMSDEYEEFAEECYYYQNATGEYIGTWSVAQDMLAIVDALGQGPLLNYWGWSYGTTLGATFAAMFPDRVGRMILEANMNVHQYWSGRDTTSRMDTDKVLEQFFAHCIEAGSLCVLNTQNQTAESLALNLEALYVALDQAPITISANATISVTKVTSWVFQQLYNERLWPKLATGLGLLYNGSYATFYNMTQQHESDTYNKGTEAIVGIKCGDSAMRFDNITEIEDLIAEQITISKWFPMSMTYEAISCGTWQMQAAGRYTGDLQVTTKTPVLFINNIYDNITPMANAYNTSAGFAGSRVLLQNSYGHIPEYSPSLCWAQAVRNYFLAGTLPAENTVCEQEIPPFHKPDWDAIYAGLTPARLAKRGVTAEDIKLLKATRAIGEMLAVYH